MPPLPFSDEEMTLLLELSRPIEPAQNPRSSTRWPRRSGGRQAGRASCTRRRGGFSGILDAAAAFAQRHGARAPRPRRLKGEAPNRNTTGDAAIYRLSSVLAFSHQPAWG